MLKNTFKNTSNDSGVTLIELLVIFIIIAILLCITIPLSIAADHPEGKIDSALNSAIVIMENQKLGSDYTKEIPAEFYPGKGLYC